MRDGVRVEVAVRDGVAPNESEAVAELDAVPTDEGALERGGPDNITVLVLRVSAP